MRKFACRMLFLIPMTQLAWGGTPASRAAISSQGIVGAMASAGMTVSASRVEFLSQVTANTHDPDLRVVTITPGTPGTARVKLRCHDNEECLPFYVVVHDVPSVSAGQTHAVSPSASKQDLTVVPVPKERVVRSGDSATLIVETSDMRMQIPVICLENGARGQKIRAVSIDRKRFYEAEVIAAGTLKASFLR